MMFEPGNVVALRSGGQPLTVVSTTAQGVQCIWIGEEGDLFSATLPAVTLELVDDMSDEEYSDDAPDENAGGAAMLFGALTS